MGPAIIPVMMAVTIAMTAAQTAMSIQAQKKQQKAREQAAARQREELVRQQRRENLIAQEQKADVMRKADRAMGTMLSQAADNGSTTSAVARLAGGIGGASGLDIARIESNRNEGRERRKSEWVSVNGRLSAAAEQTKYSIMGTAASGVGKMASSVASGYSMYTQAEAAGTQPASNPSLSTANNLDWMTNDDPF